MGEEAQSKILVITLLVIIVLLGINVGFLDFQAVKKSKEIVPISQTVNQPEITKSAGQSGPLESITTPVPSINPNLEKRLVDLEEKVAKLSQITPTPTKPVSRLTPTTALQITYIPIASNDETIKLTWTKVNGSQFYFNQKDYPGSTRVTWEVNLKVRDPNSRCSARMYDQTNSRVVDYSEVSTTQTSYQYLASGAMMVWNGNNQYFLEIKSLDGSPCYISAPRLVIK